MTAPRLRGAALALGLGLLVAPALSGCIPSVDQIVGDIVQQGIESGIENATGVDYAGGAVPSDFPGEVPLIDGDIVGGAGIENQDGTKGWGVSVTTDRSQEDIRAQLEAAGFAAAADMGESGITIPGLIAVENDRYVVTVVVGEADGRTSANYVVAQK